MHSRSRIGVATRLMRNHLLRLCSYESPMRRFPSHGSCHFHRSGIQDWLSSNKRRCCLIMTKVCCEPKRSQRRNLEAVDVARSAQLIRLGRNFAPDPHTLDVGLRDSLGLLITERADPESVPDGLGTRRAAGWPAGVALRWLGSRPGIASPKKHSSRP